MNLIDQSHKIWGISPSTYDEAMLWIERAARTCFSEDTEILTETGWKPVNAVHGEDKVLTYNKSLNILEYEKSNMFSKPYTGEMLNVTKHRVHFTVTPDHRVFATKVNRLEEYRFIKALDLTKVKRNNGYMLPLWFRGATILNEENTSVIKFNDFHFTSGKPTRWCVTKGWEGKITDELLTVIAAYISDGHLSHRNKGIVITKMEGSKLLELLLPALDSLGWNYNNMPSAGREHIRSIVISGGKPLGDWFEENCGRGSMNKKLPDFWRSLSNRQLQHLTQAMFLGDGNEETENYTSSSKILIDQMSEMYILTGSHGNILTKKPYPGSWTKHDCYETRRSKCGYLLIKPKHVESVEYEGNVFCTQTKNGIVCVRKEGKAIWLGNCYASTDKIKFGSAEKLIDGIMKSDPPHSSVLEHVSIYAARFLETEGQVHFYDSVLNSRWLNKTSEVERGYACYGNLRAWMEALRLKHPREVYAWLDQNGFSIIDNSTVPDFAKRITVELTTDRAVLAEITRHRDDCAFSVESQRYVNYDDGITFVKPSWWESCPTQQHLFKMACSNSEEAYRRLRSNNISPQHSRTVLNQQVKTTIVMSAYLPEWEWIFKLRTGPGAYPQMINLMQPVEAEFKERGWV